MAQAASQPNSAGVTGAGLPIRVRGSNLVPGQATGNASPRVTRPAHAARGLSNFQSGVARGRNGVDSDLSEPEADRPGSHNGDGNNVEDGQ